MAEHLRGRGTAERHADLDVEFHAAVARASGERVLTLARKPVNLQRGYALAGIPIDTPLRPQHPA